MFCVIFCLCFLVNVIYLSFCYAFFNSMVLFLYSVMRLCLSIVSGYLLRGYSDNLALYPKFKY